jgi:hypothetical protein
MRISKLVLAAVALLPVVVLGADSVADTARRCTGIKDSLARLVCFDKAFEADSGAAAASAAVVATAPAAAMPAVVAAAAPVVVAPSFGGESVKKSSKDRSVVDAPTDLTAVISELKETRRDVYRITLDNGQVWQQMEMESLFHVAVGDTVRIQKGSMGGYRMSRVSNGRSGWARVTRSR